MLRQRRGSPESPSRAHPFSPRNPPPPLSNITPFDWRPSCACLLFVLIIFSPFVVRSHRHCHGIPGSTATVLLSLTRRPRHPQTPARDSLAVSLAVFLPLFPALPFDALGGHRGSVFFFFPPSLPISLPHFHPLVFIALCPSPCHHGAPCGGWSGLGGAPATGRGGGATPSSRLLIVDRPQRRSATGGDGQGGRRRRLQRPAGDAGRPAAVAEVGRPPTNGRPAAPSTGMPDAAAGSACFVSRRWHVRFFFSSLDGCLFSMRCLSSCAVQEQDGKWVCLERTVCSPSFDG